MRKYQSVQHNVYKIGVACNLALEDGGCGNVAGWRIAKDALELVGAEGLVVARVELGDCANLDKKLHLVCRVNGALGLFNDLSFDLLDFRFPVQIEQDLHNLKTEEIQSQ